MQATAKLQKCYAPFVFDVCEVVMVPCHKVASLSRHLMCERANARDKATTSPVPTIESTGEEY